MGLISKAKPSTVPTVTPKENFSIYICFQFNKYRTSKSVKWNKYKNLPISISFNSKKGEVFARITVFLKKTVMETSYTRFWLFLGYPPYIQSLVITFILYFELCSQKCWCLASLKHFLFTFKLKTDQAINFATFENPAFLR